MYYKSVETEESAVIGGDDGLLIQSRISGDLVTTSWEQDGVIHEINGPVAGNKAKREVKRQIYKAISMITGVSFPWGSLTGIRPTLIASECRNDPSMLQEYYLVSETKASLAVETSLQEERIQSKLPVDLFHGYIGIPFCRSRCLYCSFVAEEYQRLEEWIPDYVDVLVREIATLLPLVEQKLQTIYIGGGTPTSLPDPLFEKLLQEISRHLSGEFFTEYTMEAGRADSVTATKLEIMKRYGVNRLCINPQTMKDKTLQRIGRNHTAQQVRDAFALAAGFGFETINMDLIAGLPGENFEDFKKSLDEILLLSPENITIHTLSLKRTSTMAKLIREEATEENDRNRLQKFHIPNQEISDMIEYSNHELKKHGYHPYYLYRQKNMAGGHENVGYSKSGHECLYNVAMMGDKNSVMAFGAGAISKKTGSSLEGVRIERLPNLRDIKSYRNRIDELIDKKRLFFGL